MYRYIFLFLLSFQLNGQSTAKIQALNNYVDFTNDCIHGLTIAHLMLQSFNNEVNALVDEKNAFAFKNGDFGRDVYDDISYYEHRGITPEKLFAKMLAEGKVLGTDAEKLNGLTTKIFKISKQLNELRFETGDYIERNDIKEKVHLDAVYKKLESGVIMFDEVFALRNALENLTISLSEKYGSSTNVAAYQDMQKHHQGIVKILKKIRAKETFDIKGLVLTLSRSVNSARFPTNENEDNITGQAKKSLGLVTKFYKDGSVPPNKERYGKFYHYYTEVITTALNTVGSGTSFWSNKLMETNQMNNLHFLDMPPMFKVLYPRKLIKSDVIASTDNYIESIPERLKERKILSNGRTITIDNDILELELFDNMLLDGDLVSVNFNGDWIIKEKSLEKHPVTLKFALNPTGKNFFILHADNEGLVSPNTMGMAYFYKGKKQKVFLESNMETSEVIEIILKK